LVVVDAVMGGGEPGSLYRLERADLPKGLRIKQSAHDSDLVEALNLCALVDKEPKTVVVIGIEPVDITPYGLELTETVSGKVTAMMAMVISELESLGVKPEKIV
jgi:hydrogenase maturation protease